MPSTVAPRSRILRLFSLVAFGMIATACSSTPTTIGDRALEAGQKWNRGTQMVKDGQELIEKGNRQIKDGNETIADGQHNVADGEKSVSEGRALIAEAEAALRAQKIRLAPQ